MFFKPENCVLDEQGTVKILDFGLATRFKPGVLLKEFCGSPEYAAPEMLKEIPYEGPPVDAWALGVILYDMVMGCLPFEANGESFEQPARIADDISVELASLLRRLLNPDPKRRATCLEAAESAWMGMTVCVGSDSELQLCSNDDSTSTASSGSMTLSPDSPLRARSLRVRGQLVKSDMGFGQEGGAAARKRCLKQLFDK